MNAEATQVGKAEAVVEPKPIDSRQDSPARTAVSAEAGRGVRSWLGHAPSGQEAGTHVVSRIGVCRPEGARR